MRLLVSCNIGDASPADIQSIFKELGWLVEDPNYAATMLEDLTRQLPPDAQAQVNSGQPFVFKPGTVPPWGIASTEMSRNLRMRLLGKSIDRLQEEADDMVRKFAAEFLKQRSSECVFERALTIRTRESEEELVAGIIENVSNVSPWGYFRERGGVEKSALIATFTGWLIFLGFSLGIYATQDNEVGEEHYWRQYADRASTAFGIAFITILVNMAYRYKTWKGARYRIQWGKRPE
ncbi:hypothetical protein [Streptomyces sp. NBC_01276]|uniref:hypothetical protein n=1 Tax=Streptomyces sp. NBC_01276 TaxID=2903808 RepID=UPI00352DD087